MLSQLWLYQITNRKLYIVPVTDNNLEWRSFPLLLITIVSAWWMLQVCSRSAMSFAHQTHAHLDVLERVDNRYVRLSSWWRSKVPGRLPSSSYWCHISAFGYYHQSLSLVVKPYQLPARLWNSLLDNLQDPSISSDNFECLLKTFFFSKCQYIRCTNELTIKCCTNWFTYLLILVDHMYIQSWIGPTVFRGPRNFKPSRGICPLPWNFNISVEFEKWSVISMIVGVMSDYISHQSLISVHSRHESWVWLHFWKEKKIFFLFWHNLRPIRTAMLTANAYRPLVQCQPSINEVSEQLFQAVASHGI